MAKSIIPDVAVLMATFNGAQWLDEQIASIFSQIEVNPILYVFDDFSTDDTVTKLLEWKRRNHRIRILRSNSDKLGVPGAYYHLINQHYEEQFISLADQDDIWRKDHLINSIMAFENNTPTVVCSPREYVDIFGASIGKSGTLPRPTSVSNAIVENVAFGNTLVMNLAFQKCLRKFIPEESVMHDSWIYLFATVFGNVRRIEKSTVLYRLHSSNRVGTRPRFNLNKALIGIRSFVRQDIEFLKVFVSGDSDKIRIVEEFIEVLDSKTFFGRLRYCFSSKCYRQKWLDNFLLKSIVLFIPKLIYSNQYKLKRYAP
jgi:glycosyltransferase involved in cell wall biosynthesis